MLERLLEEVGANAPEVHPYEILEADPLLPGQVPIPFQEDPFRLGENRLLASGKESVKFHAPNFIHRPVQVRHDVKAIQDIESLRRVVRNRIEIGFPHVTAHESKGIASLLAKPDEEPIDRLGRSLLPDPDQSPATGIYLVNQCQVFVAATVLDLIDTKCANSG